MRVAIIGDLGGHLGQLKQELSRLGADRSLRLPDDLAVIQLGDLIHRGPDSDGVVTLVERYLRDQPGQWTQLAGNHEAQYLRPPRFAWRETIGYEAQDRLRAWWSDGRMQIAVAVRAGGEDLLVTHAGLTAGFWRRALDGPTDAALAAAAINSFIDTHEDVLFHAGAMLGGGADDYTAGPVWAAAASELVPSWLEAWADSGTPLPFSLVHGHSSVIDWKRGTRRGGPEIEALLTVDEDAAHATVTLTGGRIVGVDPGHAQRPNRRWHALVLEDAELL